MRTSDESIDDLIGTLKSLQGAAPPPRLPPVYGSGNGGDMEARVAKLESDVAYLVKQSDRADGRLEAVSTDVGLMKTDVAVIKATMAGKGFIVTALGLALTIAVAALTVLSKLGILSTS